VQKHGLKEVIRSRELGSGMVLIVIPHGGHRAIALPALLGGRSVSHKGNLILSRGGKRVFQCSPCKVFAVVGRVTALSAHRGLLCRALAWEKVLPCASVSPKAEWDAIPQCMTEKRQLLKGCAASGISDAVTAGETQTFP